MNTTSEDIFHLIHSLRKSEKRSFKLSASIDKKEKLYVTLFDLIAKQKIYNEEVIVKKLKINKYIFAYYKNYLHRLILHRMTLLHSGTESQLRVFLIHADFLYQKGLYNQYRKILNKAKKYAQKFELNTYLLQILGMESRLAWKNMEMLQIQRILDQKKNVLAALNNEEQYAQIEGSVRIKFQQIGKARNPQEIKDIKEQLKNPLLANEKLASSFNSKLSLYYSMVWYCAMVGPEKKIYIYTKKTIELYIAHPEKIILMSMSYLLSLGNFIRVCIARKKYEEAKYYLDKLSKDASILKIEREKAWAFYALYSNGMAYYFRQGYFSEGVKLIEKMQNEFPEYEKNLDTVLDNILCFYASIVYFGANQYKKSIEWLNRLLNDPKVVMRPTNESQVKMFYIIAHYEKEHYDLLQSLVRSARHDLSAKRTLYQFENILLDFFENIISHTKSKKDLTEEFKTLKKELQKLAKDPNEKIPFEEFDYLSWIDSKIENKLFAEVVRERAK